MKADAQVKKALKILLVEDNMPDADLIMERAQEDSLRPLEICHQDSLREAVDQLQSNCYDAILLDLGLPDSSGLDTLKEVLDHAGSTAVIVLTGNDDIDAASECIALGAADFIIKSHANGYVASHVHNAISRMITEADLRLSERKTRALIEGMPDIVMRFDRDGRHLFVSPNVSRVVSIPPEDFIKKTHRELGFPDEQCKIWEDAIEKAFATNAPVEIDFSFEADEGVKYFNWRVIPEKSEEGKVESVVTIARDVTERVQSTLEYEALFRQMSSGFAIHEMIYDDYGKPSDYRFLDCNC